MGRARQHAEARQGERRRRLANEAARLMAESGIRDYNQARRKAASRLGIHDEASLPRNQEIEEALREYQRIFLGPAQADAVRVRREAAARAMEFFAAFQPRLVGPVLDGTADAGSPVALHLHADDPEAVARFLAEHRIPAEPRGRRVRLDRRRELQVTAWLFEAEDLAFELTVLPGAVLRQAPLSALDERPMPRASLAQVRGLLAGG
ncbi:hypothetical protein EIM48_01645 [Pseudoxanthomonas sp. SGNA-20]|jgi:hypothetical protein|uniref:Nucleotidyltransferase n=1 Tax=Pseudoxanthomonas taiwanensis J19 TaxID=935569 RepID=A0A562D4Y9_9GAMM|nr:MULTISPECIES: hypothetical protein [Pseudoxanthomonas]RRN58766.1 hypothetical protein EIM48_01645 [Pseudoxanthomonas sp. SGNA-20]RRN80739.1 hypothetical protein EIM50_02685 [Pseudoxanthomonas sp. SGD-10]TWH04817.1 hypothetical protein L613_006900000080 [Pseudoxanthomonas taiwanensis J19]